MQVQFKFNTWVTTFIYGSGDQQPGRLAPLQFITSEIYELSATSPAGRTLAALRSRGAGKQEGSTDGSTK